VITAGLTVVIAANRVARADLDPQAADYAVMDEDLYGATGRVCGLGRRCWGPQHRRTPPRAADLVWHGGVSTRRLGHAPPHAKLANQMALALTQTTHRRGHDGPALLRRDRRRADHARP